MALNWRFTAFLAAALAVAAGVYFAVRKPPGPHLTGPRPLLPDEVIRIEMARKGEPEISLERTRDAVGEYWMMSKPLDRPGNPETIDPLVRNKLRLDKVQGMAPEGAGVPDLLKELKEPRLVLTFHGKDRKETFRFGPEPAIQKGHVVFQRDGDPRLFALEKETFAILDKPLSELRSPTLVRYDAARALKVEIEERWERMVQGAPRRVEYERSVFERSREARSAGWFMTHPWKERLDDVAVNQLVADLASFRVVEFQPPGELEAKGLGKDQPELVVTVHFHGDGKPVRILFGGPLKGDPKHLFVRLEGSADVALVPREKFERLPRRQEGFRSTVLFPFNKEQVRNLLIEAPGLGRVRVERRETRTKVGDEELVSATWEVTEPKDMKIVRDRVEAMVDSIGVHRIKKFLPKQEDLKLFRLDPPDARLTFETQDGKYVYLFGLTPGPVVGYARREGVADLYEIAPELPGLLRKLELNFLDDEVFSVNADDIREFRFEAKNPEELERIFYSMRREGKGAPWKFSDPRNAGKEIEEARLQEIVPGLNYIKAEAYLSREEAAAKHYELSDREAPARLVIATGGAAPGRAVFYVSRNLGDRPGESLYYARLEGSPVVFKINALFIETLKRVPVKRVDSTNPEKK